MRGKRAPWALFHRVPMFTPAHPAFMKTPWFCFVSSLVLSLHTAAASAQVLSGAGSSAAAPIYESWGQAYAKVSGERLAYEPVGSSAGLKKIRARETQFGASDVSPSEADLAKDGLVVFPVAVTGISPVVNLPAGPGAPKAGEVPLRLTGEVLARIFLGDIGLWNAPEIAALNPERALPNLPIRVVVRSDGSGTTHNFADYLAKVSPAWRSSRGVRSSYEWPSGFLAVKGSGAMAKTVSDTPGAIGYVDHGYVQIHQLTVAQVRNAAGVFVSPSTQGFREALNASPWASQGQFTASLTQQPGNRSWPITMGTFVLVPKVTPTPESTRRALRFFVWAFMNGDTLVQANNFVRLPDRVQALAFRAISSVKDPAGTPIGLTLLAHDGKADGGSARP